MRLPRPSTGDPIKAEHIRALSESIKRLQPRSSPTVRVQETPNGITYHVQSVGGVAGAPVGGLDVKPSGIVTPSLVGAIMPTISGVRLDAAEPAKLNIPQVGTIYVIIQIEGTPAISSYAGASFVGAILTSPVVTIKTVTDEPVDGDLLSTDGIFKIHLATFVDGERTAQVGHGPITYFIQDTLDGSGTGYLSIGWQS